jgi:hypothetical protein
MPEIRTVTTLRRKRDEIIAVIRLYERQLEQARADLAHVTAAMRIFEDPADLKSIPRYIDVHRLFKRTEKWEYCRDALETLGPMNTRDLAIFVMRRKGMDPGDKVLAQSIGFLLIQSLRMQAQRGRVVMTGKVKGVCVWALPEGHPKVEFFELKGC